MKKLLLRILSYIIDMVVVILITTLISIAVPCLNRNKITELSNEYSNYYLDFSELFNNLERDYMNDSILSQEEFHDISSFYKGKFDNALEKYVDKELDDKGKTEMINSISNAALDQLNQVNYKIVRINIWINVVQFVIVVLYFGVVQFLLKGQTLGKKLFRLFLVTEEDGEVSLPKMLIRSIFVSTIIISIIDNIVANLVDVNAYTSFSNYYSYVPTGYMLIMFMFVLFREDQRGAHDLLLKTRVKLINKDGSEYTNKIFLEDEEKEEVKEAVIVEKNKKKTTTKKKTAKKIK